MPRGRPPKEKPQATVSEFFDGSEAEDIVTDAADILGCDITEITATIKELLKERDNYKRKYRQVTSQVRRIKFAG